jgi:hypothetical protein
MLESAHRGAAPAPPTAGVPFTDLVLLFVSSRLALLLVGLLSTWLMASGLSVQKGNLVYHAPAPRPLEIWSRWDSEWYLLIAGEGYAGPAVRQRFEGLPVPYEPEATAGFLPLYPMLIRLLAPLAGGVGAGVIVSNLCLFGSLWLLYRVTSAEAGGGDSGRTAGLAACAALLVFPMSLFLSAVYAESLFLLLSLAVFDCARRGRFAAAGLAGAAAALTRPFGVLLAIPLLLEWRAARRAGGAAATGWMWALPIPAALAGFMLYCARVFGDPMVFVERQSRWRGAMSGPWRAFARWWSSGPAAHGAHDSTLEMLIAVAVLATLPALFRRLRAPLSVYAAAAALLPLCSTLWSFGRFALTIFPLFTLAGVAWARGARRVTVAYAFAGSVLSGLLMALFANWWWAG